MILLLLACSEPLDGTWLFQLGATAPTGDECTDAEISHNYTGAYVAEPLDPMDQWNETLSAELSPSLFFGRIEAVGDSYVLIIGNAVYPGTELEKSWSFAWTTSATHATEEVHATGYVYAVETEDESTAQLSGTFTKGVFKGNWEQTSYALDAWSESDTWSEEAATAVGTAGRAPVGDYLVKTDEFGAEVPATNNYDSFDCAEAQCALTVSVSCLYSNTATGELTEFSSEDNRWVEDATQAPGI